MPPGGAPGNPDGGAEVPAEAAAVGTASPDQVIGDGTAASCTSAAVVEAFAAGGITIFDCGSEPVVITMDQTAETTVDGTVLDGGGLVTLSGGEVRILKVECRDCWVTVQNLGFVDGDSSEGRQVGTAGSGGGAIQALGDPRLRVVNSTFSGNVCEPAGADTAGGAMYLDGRGMDLVIEGTTVTGSYAEELGGAVFLTSQQEEGTAHIRGSSFVDNEPNLWLARQEGAQGFVDTIPSDPPRAALYLQGVNGIPYSNFLTTEEIERVVATDTTFSLDLGS